MLGIIEIILIVFSSLIISLGLSIVGALLAIKKVEEVMKYE